MHRDNHLIESKMACPLNRYHDVYIYTHIYDEISPYKDWQMCCEPNLVDQYEIIWLPRLVETTACSVCTSNWGPSAVDIASASCKCIFEYCNASTLPSKLKLTRCQHVLIFSQCICKLIDGACSLLGARCTFLQMYASCRQPGRW